jgi:hypothetical protein
MNVCGKKNIVLEDGEEKDRCMISEKCYQNVTYMIWATMDVHGLMTINKKDEIILELGLTVL